MFDGQTNLYDHVSGATRSGLLRRINSAVQLIRGIITPLSRLPIFTCTQPHMPTSPPPPSPTSIGNFLFAQLIRPEIATSCLTSLMANSSRNGKQGEMVSRETYTFAPPRTLNPSHPVGDY